ncbi:DUF4232 domain-containing protein [Specibacter sp. AOP5-B1-6]|uniref:DUF4232 domain-containing protein n=1 Tax=Specibacter sp. AOP5-B1-6 TaxID=3457653 RepID=UPI00402B7391
MTIAQRTPAGRPHLGKMFALAAVVGLGASLAACGPQGSTGQESAPPASTSSASPSASPSEPAGTTGEAPTESPAPSATATPDPALCTAASLAGALDDSGGGAAGHIYMKLVVTNSSDTECILDGYPGVSMVAAGTIDPIGAPADRDPNAPSTGPIALAPGQSSTAVLNYTQADNYQGCQHEQADSVLVYPPSATDSLEIPHPLTACGNADIKLLTIGAFQP